MNVQQPGQNLPRTWTPFSSFQLAPPHPSGGFDYFSESATKRFLWQQLMMFADIPSRGRALFSGTLAQRNSLWREFRSYMRQAKEYDDAASLVAGTSGALLLYYAMLNLAKAELLTSVPNPITGQTIRHGLSYSPAVGRTLAGDEIRAQAGIFQLLYRKRLGLPLAAGTRIGIKQLIANIPEIGWELSVSPFGSTATARLIHVMVSDGQQAWALVEIDNYPALLGNRVTAARFNAAFEPVLPPPMVDWRDVFAISRRYGFGYQWFFESRWRIPLRGQGPVASAAAFQAVCNRTWQELRLMIDAPSEEGYDATLCPSLLKGTWRPMPSSLARYALTFYVSSLVRYRPSQVDPRVEPQTQWLLSAFADQTGVLALRDALNGIRQKPHFFSVQGHFRL